MSYNVTYAPPYNLAQPGSVTYSGGGGGYLLSGARSIQDARRMMQVPRAPSAQYPDGYLDTVNSRRQDRLQQNVGRTAQKAYERGVHMGERIDPADYYWPSDFNPMTGLEFEARGLRWTAPGTQLGASLVNNGRAQTAAYRNPDPTQGAPFNAAVNADRREQLGLMRPAWR